jgi:hypothetical protein
MSNVTPQSPKQSVRKQAAGALERIGEVERNVMMITSVVNRSFSNFQQQQSALTETVDAIVSILGEDTVANAVVVARQEKATQQAEQRKAAVTEAVAKGLLVAEQTIRPAVVEPGEEGQQEKVLEPGSTVASVMLDKSGEEIPGTYYVMPMSQVKPEFRKQLEGKEVGYMIANEEPVLDDKGQPVMLEGKPTMATVNTAKILGVYKEVPPKAPSAPAATESSSVQ